MKTSSSLSSNKRKLTLTAKQFASEFVQNGQNAKQAYRAIKPDITPATAQVQGSRMLSKPIVQNEIAKLMPSDTVISEQIQTAITQQPESNISWSEKHNYITTALKLKGYLNDNKDKGNVNIALVINE